MKQADRRSMAILVLSLAATAWLCWRVADPLGRSEPAVGRESVTTAWTAPADVPAPPLPQSDPRRIGGSPRRVKPTGADVPVEPVFPAPEFSAKRQFLPAGGTLELALLTAEPNAEIRWTTNGGSVTAASSLYTGPIALTNTMMVRARIFVRGRAGEEGLRTYFFGVDPRLPIVSLAASPANFEFKNGYLFGMGPVLGPRGEVRDVYPYFAANSWQEREIEAAVEFFEPDGEAKIRQRAGLRVFGGWGSRGYPQKSLALFARRQYGKGKFHHQIFPDRAIDKFESFVLRNSGNDNQSTHQLAPQRPMPQFGPTQRYGAYFVNGKFTLMRDAMEQRLLEGMDLDTQASRPAVVYVNGEYWGIYGIREKIADGYFQSHHGFGKGEFDLIIGWGAVVAGDNSAYFEMRNFIATADLRTSAAYRKVASQYLDIDNFIDYHLAVIYFQNFDIGNIKCWRPRVGDGRFRWVVYDQDCGFGLWPPEIYLPAMARDYADYGNMFRYCASAAGEGFGWPNEGGRTLLLRRMLRNEEFKRRLVQRCADLLNTGFREERVARIIDSMAAELRPEISRHLERWSWAELKQRGFGPPYQPEHAPFVQATWETHVTGLVDFARRRPSQLRQDCADAFGLRHGLAQVDAQVVPAGAGRIRINTAVLGDFPWSGTFFRDYPVSLAAIPKPGYRFVAWSGSGGDSAEPRRSVDLPGVSNVFIARFERLPMVLPEHPPVLLTEFQYHPVAQANSGDWIELHNPSRSPIDTTGWILRHEDADDEYVFPEFTLGPGAYLVLCQNVLRFRHFHPAVTNRLGNFAFGLGNGGDTIRLYDALGAPVLELRYQDASPWPAEADGDGHTVTLRDPHVYSADPAAWAKSPAKGGSPGRPDSR